MIRITEVFKYIILTGNIFTLHGDRDIEVNMDEAADVIAQAITYGYEQALTDFAVWNDGEQRVGAGIYSLGQATEKHRTEMQLLMKTIKGRANV